MSPTRKQPVLLLGFGDAAEPLSGRLVLLGFRPLRADTPDEAIGLLENCPVPVRAALLPDHHGFQRPGSVIDALRKTSTALEVVVMGEAPAEPARVRLREAGIRLCLWEPSDDSALRFVLNQALYDPTRGQERGELRVPTGLIARITTGTGKRVAVVYNLSAGGAYLETHRPLMPGGRLTVELPLEGGDLSVKGRVVSANVVGNLQRPNLPLGMGVSWEADEATRSQLDDYVERRAAEFRV